MLSRPCKRATKVDAIGMPVKVLVAAVRYLAILWGWITFRYHLLSKEKDIESILVPYQNNTRTQPPTVQIQVSAYVPETVRVADNGE